jgi:site-specific DNA recombinase
MASAETLRLDRLIRVSQLNGRKPEEIQSPDQQREVTDQWADANGAAIVLEHDGVDVSGKTMERSDVDAAVARMRGGKTDGIIVAWLDRFSRAPVDEALRVYRDIKDAGGQVVAVDLAGINPDDETGEFTLTVMLGVGRMQWRRAQKRWDMSRKGAVAKGKAIGGAPFGYRFRDATPREDGRGPCDSRLVPDPAEARIVRELFERRAAGATWLELARWLDSTGHRPRRGDHGWHRNTVRGMIGRRTYLGEVRHGSHVKTDAHRAIVPAALWRRAQGEPGRMTPRGDYLLTGLVRCAGCGRRMRGDSGGRRGPRTYACEGRDCPAKSVAVVERLDAEVTEQLFRHLDEFHVQAVTDEELAAAEAKVAEVAERIKLRAQIAPTHPTAVAAHQAALEEDERALAEAEDHRDHLRSLAAEDGPDVRTLRGDWPNLTLDERRAILREGIDAVLVRRVSSRNVHTPVADRVLVLFRGDAPAGLVDNGRSGPVRTWTWDDGPASLRAAP